MKVAVIGSRTLVVEELEQLLPPDTTEIVSGGAHGVDTSAKKYALKVGLPYTEFLPDYDRYGRAAPIKRNDQIVEYADVVIALWDGSSRGTKYVMDLCKRIGKPIRSYLYTKQA